MTDSRPFFDSPDRTVIQGERTFRHPDEVGGNTVDEIERLAACLYAKDQDLFRQHRDELKKMLINRLNSTQNEDDLVVVPTSPLCVEALVGTHPLLEDFKLLHCAIDVKRAQAEDRKAELENLRLGTRRANEELGDPDIDKVVLVKNSQPITVDPGQHDMRPRCNAN